MESSQQELFNGISLDGVFNTVHGIKKRNHQTSQRHISLNLNHRNKLKCKNVNEFKLIIDNLKRNKISGTDELQNKLVKILFKNNELYFVQLLNLIIRNGIPDKWKPER